MTIDGVTLDAAAPRVTCMRQLARLYFGRGRLGDRPAIFTVFLWVGLVAPVLTHLSRAEEGAPPWRPSVPMVALALIILALWPLLSWTPELRRVLPAWLFAVASFGYVLADGTGTSQSLAMVAAAELTMSLGLRVAAAAAGVFGLVVWASVVVVLGKSWQEGLFQAVGVWIIVGLFAAVANVIARERAERSRVASLLAELEQVHGALATAHDELRLRNAMVRELAVAEERARLAREVHDAVGHHLTVVKLGLTNAQRLRDHDPDAAWATVAEAREASGTALEEVRRAVRALGPAALADASLGTALRTLCASYGTPSLRVGLSVEGAVTRLAPATEATLYRVAEEALTNVHRHARGATRAEVALRYCGDDVVLDVVDDGRAPDAPEAGFGLIGARARVESLGGAVEIAPRTSGGVGLRATVPRTAAAR